MFQNSLFGTEKYSKLFTNVETPGQNTLAQTIYLDSSDVKNGEIKEEEKKEQIPKKDEFSSIFEELQLQIHDPGQYMVIGLKLYKKVKKKIILVFLNIIIYFLPFCYYAIVFTKIYPGTVYVWLLSPLVGRISALLISLLHSSFISLLRFIALSFQFKQLYAISYALNIQDDEDDWMFSI